MSLSAMTRRLTVRCDQATSKPRLDLHYPVLFILTGVIEKPILIEPNRVKIALFPLSRFKINPPLPFEDLI